MLSKQCPLIVTTCEPTFVTIDEVDAIGTKPLTVLQFIHIVYRYTMTALTLGSIAYFAIGVEFLASKIYLLAIMFAWGLYVIKLALGLHVINDADEDVPEDADDVLEDADNGVAGQDDVPVEAPIAAVTIVAPLRRSKRVAAQRCEALRSAVTSRRSARLAGKPRVNYKY
jgi:hypothetical protein